MKRVQCLIFSSVLLLSCVSAALAQQTNETISVNGVTRNYIRYLPSGLNTSTESPSLIFILHGLGGSNSDMTAAGFSNIADTSRTIAVYPQGVQNNYGDNSWNNGTLLSSTADDIGFFNQLLNELLTDYNVDPSRVYFTGFSMGSIMSYHVACEMNERVAAIACMSGTMSTSDIQNCDPQYATPVIHFHGTADGTVPYNANALPSLSLVPQTMAFWKDVHACGASADSLRYPDLSNDGITVDRFRYDNCSPEASLELWRLNGAGHVYLYRPANDITEMIELWNFLNKWHHPNPAVLGLEDASKLKLQIAPNPSGGKFSVTSEQPQQVEISDLNGKLIRTMEMLPGVNQVDLSGENAGIYLLKSGNAVYKVVKN